MSVGLGDLLVRAPESDDLIRDSTIAMLRRYRHGRSGARTKPARYGDFGVPEYWVVDPEERVAWVWRFAEDSTAPERVGGPAAWHPAGADARLLLEPEELFRPM